MESEIAGKEIAGIEGNAPPPARRSHRFLIVDITRSLEIAGSIFAAVAMIFLALRAALRLELRWDTFGYHIPFAARHAGLGVPFTLTPYYQDFYDGFPPLPEFLQGMLWRLTGSINATGVLNYLALALFFFFSRRLLKARLWITVLLSLTAPMVLIHAANSYIDLFTNSLLAIGVTGLLAMILFDRWSDSKLLLWSLAGMTGAVWSKYISVPIVAPMLAALLVLYGARAANPKYRRLLGYVSAAAFLGALPYIKNLIVLGNPFWPFRLPVLSSHFPYRLDPKDVLTQTLPQPLQQFSHSALFFHSLFEIGHPTSYPNRERWIIDQGNAWIAFASGGFWAVGVITAALAAVVLGFLSARRHGWTVMAAIPLLWCLVCVLPESYHLRYYQFLPLTVAASIGMLIPHARLRYPAATLAIMLVIAAEFVWVARVNHVYFRVEKVGYQQAAAGWDITRYWPHLQRGKTYCAAGFGPAAFLLTGPTMHEFAIVDRTSPQLCPPGLEILRGPY